MDQLTFLCVAHSLATSVSISALNLVEKVRLSWLLLSSKFLRISALADIVSAGCEEVAERKLLPWEGWPGEGWALGFLIVVVG